MKFFDSDGDNLSTSIDGYMVLSGSGEWIPLKTKRRHQLSHDSSKGWDAIRAIADQQGYEVLIAGCKSRNGKFAVARFDEDGILSSVTKWLSIRQSIESGWDQKFDIAFEPGSNINSTPTLEFGVQTMGIYNDTNDKDRYLLDLKGGQKYIINCKGIGLYYPSATILNSNFQAISEIEARHRGSTVFVPAVDGLYYLDITSSASVGGIYSDDLNNDSATYTVQIEEASDDHTDIYNQGRKITLGDTITGYKENTDDQDWFSVDLEKGQIYQINKPTSETLLIESEYDGTIFRLNNFYDFYSFTSNVFIVPESGTYYVGIGETFVKTEFYQSLDYTAEVYQNSKSYEFSISEYQG